MIENINHYNEVIRTKNTILKRRKRARMNEGCNRSLDCEYLFEPIPDEDTETQRTGPTLKSKFETIVTNGIFEANRAGIRPNNLGMFAIRCNSIDCSATRSILGQTKLRNCCCSSRGIRNCCSS